MYESQSPIDLSTDADKIWLHNQLKTIQHTSLRHLDLGDRQNINGRAKIRIQGIILPAVASPTNFHNRPTMASKHHIVLTFTIGTP